MISRRAVIQEGRRRVACRRTLTGIGIALGLGLASASEARAANYRVFTANAASAMTLNANDGFCSLAEAVQHASGNRIYNCTDFAPGSGEQRIDLVESPGKLFSANHFKITGRLTLNNQSEQIHIFGSGGFIDSTAPNSSFLIPLNSNAFFERVTLTNTAGSAGGRLLENYGQLALYGITITKGDVTGSQNPSGRGGGIFNGNTQGVPGVITFAENSLITANKAKKGGGVYNDSGIINELGVTISNNTATLAGGGIYNISTTPPNTTWTNGRIVTLGAIIQGNSARTGGGVFNRGLVELTGSSITGNFTTATGSSGEPCTGGASCDGFGGGVLSVHVPSASDTRFMLLEGTISNNTASVRGGAVYSVGVLELGGNAMNSNRAPDGAALYVMPPTDGTQQYCHPYGNSDVGPATINGNIANQGGFSIVSGGSGGVLDFRTCIFDGLPIQGQGTFLTATGNSSPNFCRPGTFNIDPGCPQ